MDLARYSRDSGRFYAVDPERTKVLCGALTVFGRALLAGTATPKNRV
jgi:hypothetical protein